MSGKPQCRCRPNFMTLELTNICNLNCSICPHDKMKRPLKNMEFSLFRNIIDQAAGYLEVVDLDLYGEFTFNPRWKEMIRYAKDAGIFTVLNTNATLLDDKVISDLVDSGLDYLSLSFDGASPGVYESVRRGADYGKTFNNISRLLEINRSIFTVVQMVLTRETAGEVDGFRRLWKDSGVDAVRVKDYMPFDPEKGNMSPHKREKQPGKTPPCLFLWKNLVVCSDGTAVPCCVDYDKALPLGDLNIHSIDEIWNGPVMQELRTRHARGESAQVELCSRCSPYSIHPLFFVPGMLADDAMRRKILPLLENSLRKGIL